MTLLEEYMKDCVIVDKRTTSDGMGGYNTSWVDGAEFKAAFVLDNSIQARTAEKQGVTGLYTITTQKSMNLQFHDVIRRLEDGKIFRVTTKGDDDKTPESATINMRQVNAEEWEIPKNG